MYFIIEKVKETAFSQGTVRALWICSSFENLYMIYYNITIK